MRVSDLIRHAAVWASEDLLFPEPKLSVAKAEKRNVPRACMSADE